ncbi:hypothetical protein SynA1840_00470 [Synechococcus sp. A18-40]|nr:hypothetical protein SynA1840_00470 [Synechococcus sp. A18-40]
MSSLVLHVVTTPSGGGAQFIARNLAKLPSSHININHEILYFSNPRSHLFNFNESTFNLRHSRSPRAIYLLRNKFLDISRNYEKTIVHSHLTWPFYYCAIACIGIHNIQLVYTEHNTSNKRRNFPFFRIIDRFFYSRYTRIISISKSTQLHLFNWLGLSYCPADNNVRFSVIPNGARSFSNLNITKNFTRRPLNLISIGTLNYKKGFDNAILAIKKIEDYVEKYYILGDGPMRFKLQNLINRLELQDCIKLLGHVDQLHEFLANIDLGLVPSRVEGFGLCAIEMLSAGIPLVCTNVPGISEVLNDASAVRMTEGISSEALAEGLLYGYNNLAFREDISFSAIAFSRKYSVEKMRTAYNSVYLDLLGYSHLK